MGGAGSCTRRKPSGRQIGATWDGVDLAATKGGDPARVDTLTEDTLAAFRCLGDVLLQWAVRQAFHFQEGPVGWEWVRPECNPVLG